MKRVQLAPSILNADFGNLERALSYVEGYADVIHLDIMDGNFVPNITFGPTVVKAIRSLTRLPLDVHLMIAQPMEFIEDFHAAGADWISFHVEVTRHLGEVAGAIRKLGAKAGAALSPHTPVERLDGYLEYLDFALVMSVVPGFGGQSLIPETLDKIGAIQEMAALAGHELPVQVDGGIKTDNLELVVRAGADIVVVGSSIFSDPDPASAAALTRHALDDLASGTL